LALRVVEYIPLAERTQQQDFLGRPRVRDFSHRLPYAFLKVECIDARPAVWKQPFALFPVYHRDDFVGVDEAMAIVTDDFEVLVGHRPIKFPWWWPMQRAMPTMVVQIVPKDREQREGEDVREFLTRIYPIWVYEPLVSKFQGRWDYLERE